jgi:hypothetical protein
MPLYLLIAFLMECQFRLLRLMSLMLRALVEISVTSLHRVSTCCCLIDRGRMCRTRDVWEMIDWKLPTTFPSSAGVRLPGVKISWNPWEIRIGIQPPTDGERCLEGLEVFIGWDGEWFKNIGSGTTGFVIVELFVSTPGRKCRPSIDLYYLLGFWR